MELCNISTLQQYNFATLQLCNIANLQHSNITTLQQCKFANLQICKFANLKHRNLLDVPAGWTSWIDQLDRSAGQISWMDQLDGSAGQISSLYSKPWPVRIFEDSPFSLKIVAASKADKGLVSFQEKKLFENHMLGCLDIK